MMLILDWDAAYYRYTRASVYCVRFFSPIKRSIFLFLVISIAPQTRPTGGDYTVNDIRIRSWCSTKAFLDSGNGDGNGLYMLDWTVWSIFECCIWLCNIKE